MNKYHQEILKEIKKVKPLRPIPPRVLGTPHFLYSLNNPQKRKIVGAWWKTHKNISIKEFTLLLDSLYRGQSCDEKTIAGMFLETSRFQGTIEPKKIKEWLGFLEGWVEVDTTCQSSFEPKEILDNWPVWKALLLELNKDKNINKRRASLILLVKPVRSSPDLRLKDIAFYNLDNLKEEKQVLITKAVSWLLRSLIKYHYKEVAEYLKKNKDSLPKIVVRETMNKLKSGRKSGK